MAHEEAIDYKKHVRTYIFVFLSLAVLTVVTVLVASYHFAPVLAVTIALAIATIKAALVAGWFMHLVSERKLVLYVLALTIVFFLCMVSIIYFTNQGVLTSSDVP